MNATALLKRRDVPTPDPAAYPISRETEERVRSAHTRRVIFDVRRILETGGYGQQEVDSIVEVLLPFIRNGNPPPYEEVVAALRKRQFSKIDAEVLAKALAPAK